MLRLLAAAFRRFAESVAAGLLATIFVAFIVQIALRYVFNWPVGWTTELSLIAWLWLVLWGAAFVLADADEIRIDLLQESVGRRTRMLMSATGSVCIIVLFAMSFPAAYDYVRFMKVEKSSYMHIRLDFLFSIYLLFAVAVIARHLWKLTRLMRGDDPSNTGSGASMR